MTLFSDPNSYFICILCLEAQLCGVLHNHLYLMSVKYLLETFLYVCPSSRLFFILSVRENASVGHVLKYVLTVCKFPKAIEAASPEWLPWKSAFMTSDFLLLYIYAKLDP